MGRYQRSSADRTAPASDSDRSWYDASWCDAQPESSDVAPSASPSPLVDFSPAFADNSTPLLKRDFLGDFGESGVAGSPLILPSGGILGDRRYARVRGSSDEWDGDRDRRRRGRREHDRMCGTATGVSLRPATSASETVTPVVDEERSAPKNNVLDRRSNIGMLLVLGVNRSSLSCLLGSPLSLVEGVPVEKRLKPSLNFTDQATRRHGQNEALNVRYEQI